tara:strand:- start:420 stop:593 length:174 start_codon:yes stop_codon:yes gene_type:complete
MALKKMGIYIDLLRNEAEILRQLGEIPNDYDEDMVVEEEVLPEEEMLPEEVVLEKTP